MGWIYPWLARIGYDHPLHPPVTHIPVGLVMGAFIFLLTARICRNENLERTARHCIVLALLAAPVAVLLGVLDWQYFYAGAWLIPIRIKLVLAGALILFLLLGWRLSSNADIAPKRVITVFVLCLVTVSGLGFFGGELIYGTKSAAIASEDTLVREGEMIFAENCAMCHYRDRTETKIGPGLKDLFRRQNLPVSRKPVNAETVADQLKKPFDRMPSFPDLTDAQIQALVAYLKIL